MRVIFRMLPLCCSGIERESVKKEIIYSFHPLYRDEFKVEGLSFGSGEKALCVLGSLRGNEYQQLYTAAHLAGRLKELEAEGKLAKDKEILVIPCANPASLNIKKRFWSIDNTDINRMFPGYDAGETTQRIAAGIFEGIKEYRMGIQFASFYMKGSFMPHVRVMKTGFENKELAGAFGLPYVMVREPRPFDTTTLNYNWQIWETDAFSLYTTNTETVDRKSSKEAVSAILHFMQKTGLLTALDEEKEAAYSDYRPAQSKIVEDEDLITVRAPRAGFFHGYVKPGEHVQQGQILAQIDSTLDASLLTQITAPVSGVVLFAHTESVTYSHSAVFKLIRE